MLRNFGGQIAHALFQVVCSLNPRRIGLVIRIVAHFLKKNRLGENVKPYQCAFAVDN